MLSNLMTVYSTIVDFMHDNVDIDALCCFYYILLEIVPFELPFPLFRNGKTSI